MKLLIHIDGGSRGNPGPAAAGVVVVDQASGALIHEAGYFLGTATNNVAEYRGLLQALDIAGRSGAEQITVHTDSQLMVRQINGQYKVKSAKLRPLVAQAQRQFTGFERWEICHVARELNRRADELVNFALDARKDVVVYAHDGFVAAAPQKPPPNAGPRLDITIVSDPSRPCPANHQCDQSYTIGAVTPEGLCIHATKAAFDAIDLNKRSMGCHAQCAQCGAKIRIEPVNDDKK